MILDLWSFTIILSDFIEFVLFWAEKGSFSGVSLVYLSLFILLAYGVWKSTNIPDDVPLPPRPPFVITISGSPGNNGGRRQTLSDVRVLNSGPYIEALRRYSIPGGGRLSSTGSTIISSRLGIGTTSRGSVTLEHPVLVRGGDSQQRNNSENQVQGLRAFFGLVRRQGGIRINARSFFLLRPFLRSRINSQPHLLLFPRSARSSNLPSASAEEEANSSENPSGPQEESLASEEVDGPFHSVSTQTSIPTTSSCSNLSSSSPVIEPSPESETDRVESASGGGIDMPGGKSNEGPRGEANVNDLTTGGSEEGASNPNPDLEEVHFTIRFLDDAQKSVTTTLNEKVGDFKRRHFATELDENKTVRLIFNGRVMDNDNRTLKDAGIFDQCVIHCLIVTPQPSQQSGGGGGHGGRGSNDGSSGLHDGTRSGNRGPEPGMFFISFMGVILLFLWFICFNFGQQLFTQSAVLSLSVLTAIFLIGLVAFYLPVPPNTNI